MNDKRNRSSDSCIEIIQMIEDSLGNFYTMTDHHSAADFLLTDQALENITQNNGKKINSEENPRAGVWLVQDTPDDLFIGIHFADDLTKKIKSKSPCKSLDNSNLDAFCVFVEEISHFHLLSQRVIENRAVSLLELESQAEIDKLLICAKTLEVQYGNPHIQMLQQKLYQEANYLSLNPVYKEANAIAEKFWSRAINFGLGSEKSLNDQAFKTWLKNFYSIPLEEKISTLNQVISAQKGKTCS